MLKCVTHHCFGPLDMFSSEEELTIQIAKIDGVKIDDMDFSETGQHKVFEQFASDTAGADKEHSCLRGLSVQADIFAEGKELPA